MSTLYSFKQRRILIFVITVLVGGFLLYTLRGLISAFLGAIVMYVLFRELHIYFVEKKRYPRWLSTWIIVILSFLVLVLPFLVVGWMISLKVTRLIEHHEAVDAIVKQVQEFIGLNFQNTDIVNNSFSIAQDGLFGGVGNVLSGVAGLIFTLGVMYFLLYFMLYSYKAFERGVSKYMPFKAAQNVLFAAELRSTTFANVLGQGFISFVQGTLVGLGFWMFNYSDPLFWGTISFFVSFLPVVGAPLVFVPAAIIAFAYGETRDAISLLVWGFVLVTNIDNVIRYFISKYIADTHPIVTIIGVIIGIPVFGVLGLVFGPLLISWFLLLLKILEGSNEIEAPVLNDDGE